MLDRTIVLGGSITVVTKAQVAENLCFGTALRLSIINFISFFFFFYVYPLQMQSLKFLSP